MHILQLALPTIAFFVTIYLIFISTLIEIHNSPIICHLSKLININYYSYFHDFGLVGIY